MMNFTLAQSTWDSKELQAIEEVIKSDYFTMGKKVAKFEEDFAAFVGAKYAVMTSSGSSANLIATAALFYTKNPKLQRGDEAIVPAVSWATTYYPLYQYGLKLKFVDIDLETLNYDLEALNAAVSEKTKMIMVVNLLGNPNDFAAIKNIIKGKDIILLEDNCESLGAEFEGKAAGTFGVMGTFSTFYSHHIATMEGGFVVTDDEELYHILLCLRAHGWTRNLPKQNHITTKSDDAFSESFRFILPGYNVRPLEMSGAIGIEQLKKFPQFLEQRRENAKVFSHFFANHPDFIIQKEIGKSSWFGFSFIIRLDSKLKRKKVIHTLQNHNIESRPIVAGDFTQNEVIKYFDYEIFGDLKNAKYLHQNGFFVGNHQNNLSESLEQLAKVLRGGGISDLTAKSAKPCLTLSYTPYTPLSHLAKVA
ncbi:DegT/DnrJ/EryC1/StrS family aminotransferase [Helicobacter sp. MIT 05-5293]|uniref:DegT/DnrJ/EryC1/StrS family aminotransferase n=1 Tax=Helicobacter sp. MIT 05-5293 TaxID=1548149 RepID=UPI0010FF1463|nr:DegT/DnrJ/EryC1/StrS family aminotransferase [Helicobacter sp. MIT 05-5293]TLD82254.1 DegT/DnrJ/EryC1/StrS family aminotransferase [Helicobacter sp. MIT 05-5293]